MKKIDRETVTRILDAADIVDVVSDFVTLKRRGANYIGLCPFHSERTPSFSVSKSKGICHCFSCHKGGSPVNFLMELEQMSYQEALRWLAKKYNIEIHEREETEQEREAASLREALYAANTFALQHFENNLHNTADGQDIGLAYFKERALTPETISKFHLGYSLERADALYSDALRNGYTEENLIKAGLCARSERGPYDRFRGRVIYPVHSVSGKIVAFGGRTLKSDKTVAKYVNSPESEIYSKSRELYGLFQARRAIVKEDKCILVEGYMDVLSMSQSGVENVVASSGTALTSQQVNLIHRFTENVTVIYDADAAGIKASLRGVDMLLQEGMNVKVVLFPEGEDPDSYARTHTKEELAAYLKEHEDDFISFKTSVLLDDTSSDPLKRSHAIADILRSIAVIPDAITRQVYIDESARRFEMDAKMLALEVAKLIAKNKEREFSEKEKAARLERAGVAPDNAVTADDAPVADTRIPTVEPSPRPARTKDNPLLRFEQSIVRYLLRYGMMIISDNVDEDGNVSPLTVLDYVRYELDVDGVTFTDETMATLYGRLVERAALWPERLAEVEVAKNERRKVLLEEGHRRIAGSAASLSEIKKAEKDLMVNVEDVLAGIEKDARRTFFEKEFLSDPEDLLRQNVTDMVSDKYQLSKVHSKFTHVETEEERIAELVPRAIYELKDAILGLQILDIKERIKANASDSGEVEALMHELMEKTRIRTEFARFLGDRIVNPSFNRRSGK